MAPGNPGHQRPETISFQQDFAQSMVLVVFSCITALTLMKEVTKKGFSYFNLQAALAELVRVRNSFCDVPNKVRQNVHHKRK